MIHFDHNQHSSPPSPHQANHPSDQNDIHAWSGDQEHQYRPSTSQRHSPTHRPSAVSTTTNSPSATSPAALAKDASSRQSTPLSELSPPPDDDEEPNNVKEEDTEPKQVPSSPASQPTPSLDVKSPTLSRAGSTSAAPDPKIVLILELNSELLKVCMDFQAQGVPLTEPRYTSYSSRLQSNLTWLASVANQRQANPTGGPIPIMEPPQIIHDSPSSVRIQSIYSELPQRFARIIARHQQHQLVMPSFNNGHKRERTEDMSDMPLHKRRHTGETKMMPPPVPGMNRDGLSNGHPPSSATPVLDPGSSNPGNADAMRERTRAAQLRAAQMQQQQRQMSPASGAGPGGAPGGPAGMGTGNGMPPRGLPAQLANAPPIYQQAWQMSQNPSHPFMQQVLSNVPNLLTLPVPQQLTKIVGFINLRQQQMQQRAQMGGDNLSAGSLGGTGGNMGGGAGMGSPSISGMMPGSPGGGMSAMNQQRQMMMMQQAQARGGLNPQQQQLLLQQQERMRMEQERQRMAANGGQQSPAMSPGAAPEFAALRSNAGLPGIARSTRSPSDGAPSPMTPRVRNSGNPEEMQRMMMQRGGPNPGLPGQFGGGGVGGGMGGGMGAGMGGGGLSGGVGGGIGGINGLGGMGGGMGGGGPGGFGMPGRPSSAMGASSPTAWSNGDLGFNDGMGVLGGGRSQQSPGGGGMDLSSMGGDLGDFNWNQ